MELSPFALLGGLLATGPGVLLLAGLAASSVVFWDWRWALGSTLAIMLGVTSIQAAIHSPTMLVTAGQWLAALVAASILGLAGHFRGLSPSARTSSNWLVRLIALAFIASAWWVIDPGVSLPNFAQVETDLLFWAGLCGLLMLGLSASPLFAGIGLLLLTVPTLAMAPVLLPGSGMAIILGIAQILLALACAYLTLVEPMPARRRRAPIVAAVQRATAGSAPRPTRRPFLLPRQRPATIQADPGASIELASATEPAVAAREPA